MHRETKIALLFGFVVQGKVDEQYYLDYCMRAYCTGFAINLETAESAACTAISLFAGECAKNKIVVQWRSADHCRKLIYNFTRCCF